PALDDDDDLWLQATVDGQVLPAPPARLLAEGRQARVPLLIGSNAQELVSGGLEGVTARLRRDYPGQADAVLAGYDDTAGRYGDTAMQLSTDLGFRCPALRVAQLQAAAGAPTWHYEFDLAGPGAAVTHSAELAFVFKGLPIGTPALTLQRYWAAFAHAGDPNVAGLPAWPAFAPDRTSLRFTDAGAAPVGHLRQAICEHLDRP
ncbi:carboxylesterase family protein, partial [Xanthomonas sp. Kuri4-2]